MRGIRRYVISVVVVAVLAAGLLGTILALDLKPRLGLDLRGGLSVVLTAPPGTKTDVLDKTLEILRSRVDRAGVAEPELSREGSQNILIQLPGTDDPERLLQLIGKTAQLQFRQVMEEMPRSDAKYQETKVSESDDAKSEVVLLGPGESKFKLAAAELTGDAVRTARGVIDQQNGQWYVEIRFKSKESKTWEAFTGRLACLQGATRQVAIVLDSRVESHPEISQQVQCNQGIGGGTTVIEGNFTQEAAQDLALVLNTGALPVKLEQSEVRTVSPTLGKESLRAGLLAGAFGLALVMLFVLIYYRALGLQTWIGLLVFASIIYGLIVLFGVWIGWSLTLAGIAGLIVSIGVATDSYIVFFERVKEEVHEGRTLRSSIDRGFAHAWRTLRTANGITILAAVILYLLAVGPVRGFALALGVATTLDLIIFAALTWPLAALLARSRFFAEGRFIGMRKALEGERLKGLLRKIYRSEFDIDFVGRRRLWLAVSGVLVAISIVSLLPVRGLQFGIDFRGGTIFRAPLERSVTTAEVSEALRKVDEPAAVVQVLRDRTSGRQRVQVQTQAIRDKVKRDAVIGALLEVTGAKRPEVDVEAVGEKWGRQITTKAVRGLIIFLVLVVLYMTWRLEAKMALAGIVALVHDMLITAGIYALVGFEVSPASVIALLTILGYSLYDTVVVFDKIRENTLLPSNARRSFGDLANDSTNQVLMRSISTSLTTLLPVGSLLFVGSLLLGADSLKDLALALFVGIAAGTYSSIFVATPLLSIWKEREPRYASVKAKVLREASSRPSAPPAAPATPPPPTPDEAEEAEEEEAASVGASAGGSSRSGPRAPVRTQQRKQSRARRKKNRR
ncbi:MAG: protein translocase subunit SecD [Actinomycetota bacterium]